ncbi:DUF192 domain-containing protein [Paracoccus sp. ME4]|uniref:DUF192 domain-containing protein n=1 Tax=Paracoccus sp. ME4 TaxID=3138066 RepID=UPI00398B1674
MLMAGSAAIGITTHLRGGHAIDARLEQYEHCERMRVASHSGDYILAELALSAADQERGLRDRDALAADGGMVFIFPEPVLPDFWMNGVAFPLDLIFVAPGGAVLEVHRSARPGSVDLITPSGPIIAAVETAPGRFADLSPGTQLGFDCAEGERSPT